MTIWDRIKKSLPSLPRRDRSGGQKPHSMSRRELLEFLSEIPLFSKLPGRVMDVLGGLLEEETFPRGKWIARQGQEGDRLWIIVEGEVEVRIRLQGKRSRTLARLSRGNVVGEMALSQRRLDALQIRRQERIAAPGPGDGGRVPL